MTGSTSRLVFAAVILAVLGANTAAAKGLEGTSWQLLQLGPNGALSENLPTVSFAARGKVSGSTGCNTFTGTVTTSGMVLKFITLKASSKQSCSEQVEAQETIYLKALEQAQTFELSATNLAINTKAFNEPLSFVPAKP